MDPFVTATLLFLTSLQNNFISALSPHQTLTLMSLSKSNMVRKVKIYFLIQSGSFLEQNG